jgi:quinol monooxygenase YgiN
MSDENIVLFARLKVKKEAVETAKKAALAIIEDSRAEKGCINYDFHLARNLG